MLRVRNILHPTDFSPHAEYAWHVACALARDYGARLVLLHVQSRPTVAFGEFGMLPPEEPERTELVNRLEAMEPTHPAEVARFVVEGEPAPEIIRMAEDQGCDLIVMGTHGRKGLGRLLMGSVAEQVVRRSGCPVMVVKNPMAELETGFTTEAVEVGAAR